jgi:hypothetical protein
MMRLNRALILVLLLLHFSLNGNGQPSSRLGIELGVVSSIPQEFTSIYGTTYFAPSLISPVLGVKWLWSKNKSFEFSGGLQYEMYGTRFRKNDMPTPHYTYIENITFHKLCFPLTAGLNIKLTDGLSTIVSAGILPNLMVSGNYFVERNERMGSQTYTHQYIYNPLISEWGLNAAERVAFQYAFGVSARLKNNEVSINYIPGYQIRFEKFIYPPYYRELMNNEFTISLIHLFSPLKTKSGTQNVGAEETLFLKNSIGVYFGYVEGNLYYERNLLSFRRSRLNVRTGLGYFTLPTSGGDIYSKNIIFNISFPYITGEKNSHLELDLGLKYLVVPGSIPDTFFPDIFAGYRYEKPSGRFFFRAGVSSLSLINLGCGLNF